MQFHSLKQEYKNLPGGLVLLWALALQPLSGFANEAADALTEVRQEREMAAYEEAQEAYQQEMQEYQEEQQRRIDSQLQAQKDNMSNNQSGANMSNMLGIGLTAAGTVMIIVGSSQQNPGLVAAGVFMVAGGMGAMATAGAMGGNAAESAGLGSNLGSLAPPTPPTPPDFANSTFDPADYGGAPGSPGGSDTSSGAEIPGVEIGDELIPSGFIADSGALQNGNLGKILDRFEAATGMDREELAASLAKGKTPGEILDGIGGIQKDDLNDKVAAALQNGNFAGTGSGNDLEDLAKKAGLESLLAGASQSGSEYSGGGRGLASKDKGKQKSKFDFDALKPAKAVDKMAATDEIDFSKLSERVRRQLAKEGHSNFTIFQMVHKRYLAWTPMMLGKDRPEFNVPDEEILNGEI